MGGLNSLNSNKTNPIGFTGLGPIFNLIDIPEKALYGKQKYEPENKLKKLRSIFLNID